MSTEQNTAPVETTVAQPATSELQPGQGAPVDGGVPAEEAQPDAAALAAAAEAEAAKVNANRERTNKRFSDLSRERNQALEEAAYWRGVAEAARTGQQPPQPQSPQGPQAPAQADGPPDPNDTARYPAGEFDQQYFRDLARYEAKQTLIAEREAEAKAREFESGRERYHATLDAIEAETFDGEPTGEAAHVMAKIARTDRGLCDIITAARNPAWIAEHFARIPSDVSYALGLSPVQRALLIGQLDAKYGAYAAARPRHAPVTPQPAPAPQTTSAPQPTPPQSTLPGRGPTPTFNPDTASIHEFEARLAALRRPA